MTKPLWTPGASCATNTTLGAFSSWLSSRAGKPLNDYDKLHRFSIEKEAEFWSELWDFTSISGDKGQPPFLVDGDRMPCAQFFPDAQLNFAENLLRHSAAISLDSPADRRGRSSSIARHRSCRPT